MSVNFRPWVKTQYASVFYAVIAIAIVAMSIITKSFFMGIALAVWMLFKSWSKWAEAACREQGIIVEGEAISAIKNSVEFSQGWVVEDDIYLGGENTDMVLTPPPGTSIDPRDRFVVEIKSTPVASFWKKKKATDQVIR